MKTVFGLDKISRQRITLFAAVVAFLMAAIEIAMPRATAPSGRHGLARLVYEMFGPWGLTALWVLAGSIMLVAWLRSR